MTKERSMKYLKAAGMLLIAALPIAGVIVFRSLIMELSWQSYVGIFVLSFVSTSGTLVGGIPLPALALTFVTGSILNPLPVGIVAGFGSGLGEVFSYPVGTAGRLIADRWGLVRFFSAFLTKYGGWAVLLAAAIPNPFFDFVGLASGLAGYPFPKFMLLVLIGRLIRALSASYLGAHFAGNMKLP